MGFAQFVSKLKVYINYLPTLNYSTLSVKEEIKLNSVELFLNVIKNIYDIAWVKVHGYVCDQNYFTAICAFRHQSL